MEQREKEIVLCNLIEEARLLFNFMNLNLAIHTMFSRHTCPTCIPTTPSMELFPRKKLIITIEY